MIKFATIVLIASSLGCASPESLGNVSSHAALTAASGEAKADDTTSKVPPTASARLSGASNCENDKPEVRAAMEAEAAEEKKRPKVPLVPGYRIPAALKSKTPFDDHSPRIALPEPKMTEKERLARLVYDEEYAKLEKKHAGDPKKLRDEAWAIKRKLLTP